jgi:hypothetical protein
MHVSSSYGWGLFCLMKKLNYALQLVYNVCVIGANMLACQSLCLSKQITYIFKILIDYISMFQRFPLLWYPFILFLLDFEVYYSPNFNCRFILTIPQTSTRATISSTLTTSQPKTKPSTTVAPRKWMSTTNISISRNTIKPQSSSVQSLTPSSNSTNNETGNNNYVNTGSVCCYGPE